MISQVLLFHVAIVHVPKKSIELTIPTSGQFLSLLNLFCISIHQINTTAIIHAVISESCIGFFI
jgi:hypothetical protein